MKKLLSALLGIFGLFIVPAYAALPYGYTQLEYIESTGTQYIDTQYTMTNTSGIKIVIDDTATNSPRASTAAYFVGSALQGSYMGYFTRVRDNTLVSVWAWNGENVLGTNITSTYSTVYINYMNDRKFIYNNGTRDYVREGDLPTLKDATGGLYLFNISSGGGVYGGVGKMYSAQITENQSIVHNLVPAQRNSDGAVGMYDTVSGVFYENKGTGSFIAGPIACDGTVVNYTSATGTVSQSGTPTPDNPIEPTFYTQGDMILRAVGDYKDSYDATTGKITRRVGVRVLNGTENWKYNYVGFWSIHSSEIKSSGGKIYCTHFESVDSLPATDSRDDTCWAVGNNISLGLYYGKYGDIDTFKQWLAEQYANGTPVTVWYPLETETTEDWPAEQCATPIKIATTKYNESAFSPLNTALANAISVVDTVVSNTITQAASIATLQTQKQTRPADDTCPAYKQCLLVEDENGTPHWYEITDPFRDFVAPIIANNVAPASTTNDAGYTQLEYIRSDGASWIDTGITGTQDTAIETKFINLSSDSSTTVLIGDGWSNWSNSSYLLSIVAQTGAPNRIGGLNNTLRDFWRTRQEFVVKMDKTGLYVNNSKINWNGSATNFTTTKPLYLLGDPAASGRNSYATLYYMKIYNNGTLVRDFVPVKRNSDGAIGMYDTVSKRFFGNKGTGTFTAGPNVANTDVPANPTWTATWAADATTGVAAGTVYGEGLCNGVSGTNSTPATNEQTASANWNTSGVRCWCRATGVDDGNDTTTVDGVWVFYNTYGSSGDCATGCASACVEYVNRYTSFRSAVLGM